LKTKHVDFGLPYELLKRRLLEDPKSEALFRDVPHRLEIASKRWLVPDRPRG
jgi:hypothetical protein